PASVLSGLIAGQPSHVSTEVPTETQTEIPSEAKAEIPTGGRNEARIDTRTDISGDARTDAPIDVRMGIPGEVQVDAKADAPEAKLASTVGHHAAIAVMQPGLAAAHPGKTGTDASTAMPPIAASNPSRTPGILAAAATPLARTRQAIVTQDIQDEAAIKLELATRRGASQQMEFSSREFSVAGQTGKSEKSLLELAAKDIHALGLPSASTSALTATPTVAPTALAAIATDYGAVPAATGALVHTALWLEPRVGTAGWDNALGQKVLWMVSNQQQVAELNLDPPDLGPLQVILSITDDQASATFVSQHADVRQALEAALPRLKEMMAESGISLGNTTVSAETSQQQGGFERQYRPGAHPHRGGDAMDAPNVKSVDIGTSYTNTGRSRLVDTFA
ncbi:MAG: flagellar hook-length control protein FliK, partial [Nitrosospira sp.]